MGETANEGKHGAPENKSMRRFDNLQTAVIRGKRGMLARAKVARGGERSRWEERPSRSL